MPAAGQESDERPRRRRGVVVGLVGIPLTLLATSIAVYQASSAAFTASTSTGTNGWETGRVSLDDDLSGAAMFTVDALMPGENGGRCITVTYQGNLPADVRLYVADAGGSLGQYLDLVVQEGSGGTSSCAGFVAEQTLSMGHATLSNFTSDHTRFDDGVSTWQPTGPGQTRVYRIAWRLRDDNAAQGRQAGCRFVWEARTR